MLFLFSSLPSEAADARQLQEQRLHEALLRLAAGEIDAMSVLYENSKTAVFALALSILKNRQDAEDILHDTFVQLYRMADRYDRGGRPLSWILTMTRNLCLMQLRRKSRTEVSAEDLEFPETENPFATAEDRMILQTAVWKTMNGRLSCCTLLPDSNTGRLQSRCTFPCRQLYPAITGHSKNCKNT